jgi:hypothetical protein
LALRGPDRDIGYPDLKLGVVVEGKEEVKECGVPPVRKDDQS